MKIDAVAIIDLLKDERDIYRQLLDLSREEQQLILDHNTGELTGIIEKKEYLLSAISDLEGKRISALKAGDEKIHLSSSPNLAKLIETLDEDMAIEAGNLRDELIYLIESVAEINLVTTELLKRNLSSIDFLFRAITRNYNPAYGSKPGPKISIPRLVDGLA